MDLDFSRPLTSVVVKPTNSLVDQRGICIIKLSTSREERVFQSWLDSLSYCDREIRPSAIERASVAVPYQSVRGIIY